MTEDEIQEGQQDQTSETPETEEKDTHDTAQVSASKQVNEPVSSGGVYQDLVSMLRILLINSWLIILITLIGGAITYLYVERQPSIYEASVSLIASPVSDGNLDGSALRGIDAINLNVVGTYIEVLRSRTILRAAGELVEEDYEASLVDRATIDIRPVNNSSVIVVNVQSEDNALARDMANAVAATVAENSPVPALASTYPLQVLDAAVLPATPVLPDRNTILLLGVGASLILGVGLAFLLDAIVKSLRGRRARRANTAAA